MSAAHPQANVERDEVQRGTLDPTPWNDWFATALVPGRVADLMFTISNRKCTVVDVETSRPLDHRNVARVPLEPSGIDRVLDENPSVSSLPHGTLHFGFFRDSAPGARNNWNFE